MHKAKPNTHTHTHTHTHTLFIFLYFYFYLTELLFGSGPVRVLYDSGGYLFRVLSGEELEVCDSGVLLPPQRVGGAAQEQRR